MRRGASVVVGGVGDGGRPARPPLPWVPAFAGTTRGGAGDGGRGRPCPGFPLSRERRVRGAGNDERGREGWGRGRAAHPPLPWVPAFAGTTRGGGGRPARPPLPWVPAFAGTTRGGRGTPRPSAPALGSRFRGNDERGTGDDERGREGWGRGRPAHPPLPWVPAFAGTTEGARERREGGGGRPARPPLPWVPAFAGTTRGGERGNDERGREGWGRGRAAHPPLPWVPAFAGTTSGGERGTTRGVVKGGDGDAPRIRPCPGFPLSRERREGGGGRREGS